MNLPNKLTCSRFVLTVAFLAAMFSDFPFNETLALGLFLLAGITDYLDGVIARRNGLVTNFGILMDPLADKILVCSAFIAFVGRDLIPAWMVVVIVSRELAITGLRLLAASRNVVLAAERYGKHKTLWQMVAIVAILIMASSSEWPDFPGEIFRLPLFGKPWIAWLTALSKWLAVIFTAISGALYLWRNRQLYLQDV
jgi:CDP-diacylglycerol---glycerol-3-phosphate 3-phosphatidyltransferase